MFAPASDMKAMRTHCASTVLILIVLLPLLFSPDGLGKTKKPPKLLPPEILRARSVCFDHDGSDPWGAGLEITRRLQEWGRFSIVDDCRQADLILLFDMNTSGTVVMFVQDSSHRKVLWNGVETEDVSVAERFGQLVDRFHERIEADEAQLASPARKP